jgi:ubiquinone/menaquinone biosynthesis C-methylase UbiE
MSKHVCPYFVGYWLANPLRRFIHNPDKILAPFVAEGMTVLDIGPGMGFFSLPMAEMVGPGGKVVCADVQERMLRSLERRAAAAQLEDRIVLKVSRPDSLCLGNYEGKIDFALVFAVVHEVTDVPTFFTELSAVLKPNAMCLVAEPKGHVTRREFEHSMDVAGRKGLCRVGSLEITWSHAAVLKKELI